MRQCLVMLVLLCLPLAAQTSKVFCETTKLRVELPRESQLQPVGETYFWADAWGTGFELYLRNSSTKTTTDIHYLLDALDETGQRILTLKGQKPWDSTGDSNDEVIWDIKPQKSAPAHATSFFRTAACPARLTITKLDVEYSDGTHYLYAAARVSEDASAANARVSPYPSAGFQIIQGFLILSDAGKARLQFKQDVPEEIKAWLINNIANMRFSPAKENGRAIESRVAVLIVVDALPKTPDSDKNLRAKTEAQVWQNLQQNQTLALFRFFTLGSIRWLADFPSP